MTTPDLQGMVSNPGLPMTAGLHYTEFVIVYTACDKVECVVDGAPPGKNGRLFIVETNKPARVPWLAAKFMLEHLQYTGVVQVKELEQLDEDGNVIGMSYDVEDARQRSLAIGKEQDEMRFMRWVSDMMEDYINRADGKQKVPPPPPEPIRRIIERRGYKMQEYGIKPIGFRDPIDVLNEERDAENKALKEQLKQMQGQIDLLIKMKGGSDAGNSDVQGVPPADRAGTGRPPRRKS